MAIISENGQLCRVLSCWPCAKEVSVRKDGDVQQTKTVAADYLGWFEFATEAGATCLLDPRV